MSTMFSLSMEMSRLTRGGTAEPVSLDQILRRERGQGNFKFPFSADHVQDWQPYPVDPYSCCMCDHTYIRTYMFTRKQKNSSYTCVRRFKYVAFLNTVLLTDVSEVGTYENMYEYHVEPIICIYYYVILHSCDSRRGKR